MGRHDTEAFARLYDEHVWSVYGFFGYRVRTRQEAEDLTQATFENALRAWHSFDESRGSFATWLMTIARNLLTDHYRRDRSALQRPIADEAELEAAAGSVEQPSLGLSPDLEAVLGRLGERERELIALRFGADLSGLEIARLTGLTVANVHQILSRSLRRLRTDLEAEQAEAEGRAAPDAGAARGSM
jgi:RNA polymerase sigma factor (sigma-70 family)